ncbi:glutamate-1-semialdehyde 2,1-aminomutase [Alsobacter soli]|uniref:Glutamate-1-semialdehyde 2,1-aminomutase n=1 Tax=Alsobacter soli TaxID=2109933 RepID=A0A2T1HMN9_9HYPH|nr:aspartate aminotransferase family protein [Alsobacter soli]PSC02893.1 glutamate-1-semialdehyde 2,1-aminomutase [Alsobacter soli]
MARWPEPTSRSKQLYERGLEVFPGGITRTLPWQEPFPVYAAKGEGAYVVDVDGTRRLDLLNNFATLVHGHAHPAVVEAVRRQVGDGTAFALPTEREVALAEVICARAESFEQIRFCNSGSEAVMSAIKAARALTGRPKIVKAEGVYHGSYDYAEVSLDSNPSNWGNDPISIGYSKGVPKGVADDVVVVPFNDVEAAERIIRANAPQIAAVLMDPAPSYLGFTPMSQAFIDMIERVTREIGAVFILDEVITFRAHRGGAQTLLGIDPDITTLGKIIGGGFPVGAVAGRRAFMSVYDHRAGKPALPWSGTFTANPVTMTAGQVTLELLDDAAIDRINHLNERLVRSLNSAFERSSFPGQVTGFASMFMIFGHKRPIVDYRSAYASPAEAKCIKALQRGLTEEGFHIAGTGKGFLSTPMTEADIESFMEAVIKLTKAGLTA